MLVTLDDGPDSRRWEINRTKRVLDKLKALEDTPFGKVNAVFFVQTHALDDNGSFNRGMSTRGQQLLARMGQEKHMAAVHTGAKVIGAHAPKNYHTKRVNEIVADLNRAWDECLTVYGHASYIGRYVRPPAGEYRIDGDPSAVLSKYREANFEMVLWDVDPRDWDDNLSITAIETNIQTGIEAQLVARKRDLVILLHDMEERTVNNLERYLNKIQKVICDQGFTPRFNLNLEEVHQILRAQSSE